jgi:predicted amidohydrolase YtcJ
VHTLKNAGAILIAGSDAPVNTRDPQPFVNMSIAVTRALAGRPPLNAAESVPIRDVIDAYTINGAKYLKLDKDAGSIEVGKSADFVVVDHDLLALGDANKAAEIAKTNVLDTYFMGKRVYRRQ